MSHAGRPRLLALLIPALAAACAGNGNGLDSNGNPIAPGGGVSQPLTADFASIQEHVLTPICTRCHIGAGAPEGLQLDSAHSYALLVGVPSAEQPAVLRVSPGDPDSSYLLRKLEGAPGISGAQMPFGGPYLPQATLDVIRQWIAAGAPRSGSASLEAAVKAVQMFAVAVTSPDDQSITSEPVERIVVEFNSELDSNTVGPASIRLWRTGAGPDQPVPASVSASAANPAALLIEPGTPLGSGSYRVDLQASVRNAAALTLGSTYSFTFTVDPIR
jgi:hypothetical protein